MYVWLLSKDLTKDYPKHSRYDVGFWDTDGTCNVEVVEYFKKALSAVVPFLFAEAKRVIKIIGHSCFGIIY
jgi:hypothetical protein